jgi:hypothetical protein
MAVLKLPIAGLLIFCLLAGFSCRSSHVQPSSADENETISGRAFDSGSLDQLKEKHKENFILGKKLEEEADWLRVRLQMVEAELKANRTKEIELKLLLEMAKYAKISDRIPDGEGFITDRQKAIWDARLDVTREDYKLSLAKVRLLQRDLDELREEFAERGRHAPKNSVFK